MKRISLAVLFMAALAAGPALADKTEEAGKAEYMVACAGCHGETGKGQGPFAPVLNIATPDLTQLTKRNDGQFPFQKTFMIIDGRTGVRGHGGPMPIWGDRYKPQAFEDRGPYGSELVIRGRILSLVLYLQTLQE
ncbi:cytochrome c [Cereibacter sphaeroides]|uniref:c-type cytochrome n=1 Tax=Rhodobacterales TaxID=204455 RepID=UPI0018E0B70F|nr:MULTISPECIES: cytochrome c [Paracoccaceae]MCE6953257.1 cytochrome c [Cereibacter sphaeroides]MCE6961642.1 cytochrome c [Cereibacter sphaeroides]MCE6968096.1 cytochrome c [Cereibacter sphaeroides]MCE6974992.1 cytochrome c [Cereibacter sphaeroides]